MSELRKAIAATEGLLVLQSIEAKVARHLAWRGLSDERPTAEVIMQVTDELLRADPFTGEELELIVRIGLESHVEEQLAERASPQA
jgi:hypothetical protein